MSTAVWPSLAALSAATFTTLARSAPLKPGVPLAITYVGGLKRVYEVRKERKGRGRKGREDNVWLEGEG